MESFHNTKKTMLFWPPISLPSLIGTRVVYTWHLSLDPVRNSYMKYVIVCTVGKLLSILSIISLSALSIKTFVRNFTIKK